MLRNVRKITPLLRSLVLGVATVSAVSVSSAVLVGCEDENQPEYYTKRLDDPALRPQSIKRLVQFFEDAMTRADKNRDIAPGAPICLGHVNSIPRSMLPSYRSARRCPSLRRFS